MLARYSHVFNCSLCLVLIHFSKQLVMYMKKFIQIQGFLLRFRFLNNLCMKKLFTIYILEG